MSLADRLAALRARVADDRRRLRAAFAPYEIPDEDMVYVHLTPAVCKCGAWADTLLIPSEHAGKCSECYHRPVAQPPDVG